jgi:hypothetical protein
MNPIVITTRPYKSMRYPTLGDWYYENGELRIVELGMVGYGEVR